MPDVRPQAKKYRSEANEVKSVVSSAEGVCAVWNEDVEVLDSKFWSGDGLDSYRCVLLS